VYEPVRLDPPAILLHHPRERAHGSPDGPLRPYTPRWVPFHIRRLRAGRAASEAQIGLARARGVVLRPGQTYVKGHGSPTVAGVVVAPEHEVRTTHAVAVLERTLTGFGI
jgi:hypothetical protein